MNDLSSVWIIPLTLAVIWEFSWKGWALWRAAHNEQIGWYIAILLINSLGILPIVYLLLTKGDSHERAS